jgi:acyl-homoserine lactone acylase PvdQ
VGRGRIIAVLATCLTMASSAQAAPTPAPYGSGQHGRFFHIIPPGQRGGMTAPQAVAFLAGGALPPHSSDQRDLYTDLIRATPGMTDARIGALFPDAGFGVPAGEAESTESPREDVTIQRDRWGRPHIYGTTRSGTMFGAGYSSAEDCLVFMDVLRHYGAGQLSWAGGANVGEDEATWMSAPYTQEDRGEMLAQLPRQFGPDGAQLLADLQDYVDGVNAYIARVRFNPTELPAEYLLLGHPEGPVPWHREDVLAVATLIGGQLGNGGGSELSEVELLQANMKRWGTRKGYGIWRDLREADDPEAPVTATRKRGFPYGAVPKTLGKDVALPDPGSLRYVSPVVGKAATRGAPGVRRSPLLQFPKSMSNALLLSAAKSATGHPLTVMGSQASYFEPEIWRYQDLHGPGIDVAGANIPGTGPFVEIGHGPDYVWSATSAGQDMIDVYAVELCRDDEHYLFRGRCTAMEPITQRISWSASAGDATPSGAETLRTLRTKLGLVVARATIKGKRFAYTKLRSTYRHELDSAMAFMDWNTPARIRNAKDFQRAAFKLGYTFNWLYADDRDIAYINTGANPVRARGANGVLPQRARRRTEWRGFDPGTYSATFQPFSQRPQAINQPYLVSWNNKQAHHCCGNGPYGPIFRSQALTDAIDAGLRAGGGKMTLSQLVDAAEFGGVADLRGLKLIPWALRVLGKPAAAQADAVAKLEAWVAAGAPRADRAPTRASGLVGDGHYDHADAVRIADTWVAALPRHVFLPRMGKRLFELYDHDVAPDEPNRFHSQRNAHMGSSWEEGWFHYLQKDLRTVLGKRGRVQQPWRVRFCGNGSLQRCRHALAAALDDALKVDTAKLWADPTTAGKCGRMDAQMCFDSLAFRAIGALTQPNIPWQNRPTQQQVAEVTGHR